jgi:hypothetical protein
MSLRNECLSAIKNTLDNKSDKTKRETSKDLLKYKVGTIVSYDKTTTKAVVKFPDSDIEYQFYDKTGEVLSEGDTVRIEYTSNLSQGIIAYRLGIANPAATGNGTIPITAIVINSNFDFTISTNTGTERYVAVEET